MTDEEYAWIKAYDFVQGKVVQIHVDWIKQYQFSAANLFEEKGKQSYKMLSHLDEVLRITTLDGLKKLGKMDGNILVWELLSRLELLKGKSPTKRNVKEASDILEKNGFEDINVRFWRMFEEE